MDVSSIRSRLEQAIAEQVFPGCVLGVVTRAGQRMLLPVGRFTYEADSPAMSAEAVFDVASITKVVPTSSLALMLIDKGTLSVRTKVRSILPELAHSRADAITVQHLLTHTLDFGFALSSLKDLPAKEILHAVLTRELAAPPGTAFCYSNATSILLGMLVERVTDQALDRLAKDALFEPLGMRHTTFHPEELRLETVVPAERDPWRGRTICGEVHDESAWRLREAMVAGSAGLFSTVPDLLTFVQMVLNRGELGGGKFFSERIVSAFHTNQIAGIGASAGLGWELNQPRYMGRNAPRLIGKTGFTGCAIMCCPEEGTGLVLLSNFTFPRRKATPDAINQVRRDVADLVFA